MGCGSATSGSASQRIVHYGKGFLSSERNKVGVKIFSFYNTDANIDYLPTFDEDAFINCKDPEKT
jgi:hypothetical protein